MDEQLSGLCELEIEGCRSDVSPWVRRVLSGAELAFLQPDAPVRPTQTGKCGRDCGPCGMASKEIKE